MKIGIAGAGGLGSNVALNLVRSGVKEIFICDFDKIEKSNLNRQFYFEDQIGEFKAVAIKENLTRIDSTCKVVSKIIKVEIENLKELFDECDVIVEAFDSAEYKRLLVEEYLNTDKLIVCASGVLGFDLELVRVKKFGQNCFVVGDFKTTNFNSCSTKLTYISAIMADIVLKNGDFYDRNI